MSRIPASAYEDYLALGPNRSYQVLADRLGVSKTAITNKARRENWQERIAALEEEGRRKAEARALDEIEKVRERHLKEARFLQARALQALRDLPPEKGVRAANALATAWRHELLILGEPTERAASVEEKIKGEYERWMEPADDVGSRNGHAGNGRARK
jgi:ATPase subunit of ABC transporter with duplicated ATPase domains